MNSYIYRLAYIFLFRIGVMSTLSSSVYGMEDYKVPTIDEYYASKHGRPTLYPQYVYNVLDDLPAGHPCKGLRSDKKNPKDIRNDILSQCNARLNAVNEAAAVLQAKLLAEERLRKQKEEALARERELHRQKQRQLEQEQKKAAEQAALLKKQEQAALERRQQEEARAAAEKRQREQEALLKREKELAAAEKKKQEEEKKSQEEARAALLKKQREQEAAQVALEKEKKEQEALLKRQKELAAAEKKSQEEARAALLKKQREQEAAQAALEREKKEQEALLKRQKELAAAETKKQEEERAALLRKKQEQEAQAALVKRQQEQVAAEKKKQEDIDAKLARELEQRLNLQASTSSTGKASLQQNTSFTLQQEGQPAIAFNLVSVARSDNNDLLFSIIRNKETLTKIMEHPALQADVATLPHVRQKIFEDIRAKLDTPYDSYVGKTTTLKKTTLREHFARIVANTKSSYQPLMKGNTLTTAEETLQFILDNQLPLDSFFAELISVLYGLNVQVLTPISTNSGELREVLAQPAFAKAAVDPLFVLQSGVGNSSHFDKLYPANASSQPKTGITQATQATQPLQGAPATRPATTQAVQPTQAEQVRQQTELRKQLEQAEQKRQAEQAALRREFEAQLAAQAAQQAEMRRQFEAQLAAEREALTKQFEAQFVAVQEAAARQAAAQAATARQQSQAREHAAARQEKERYEAELASKQALIVQQRQQYERELQQARRQIEELQAVQPQRVTAAVEQFNTNTETALASLVSLIFNANDKTTRHPITDNAGFLKNYSEFLIVHSNNLEEDEEIAPLNSYLSIPERKVDAAADRANLSKINSTITTGVDVVKMIAAQLNQFTDTPSESYREGINTLAAIVNSFRPNWTVIQKLNYLDKKVKTESIASKLGNVLGAFLLMNQDSDKIQQLMVQFKYKAFQAVITHEQYQALFQLWALITQSKIKEFQFHELVVKGLKEIFGNEDLINQLNTSMNAAIAQGETLRASFNEVEENRRNNELCDFFDNLGPNINLQMAARQRKIAEVKGNCALRAAAFISGRVAALDQEINSDQGLIQLKNKINNNSPLKHVTSSMKQAKNTVITQMEQWVDDSLTSFEDEGKIKGSKAKLEESLKLVFAAGIPEIEGFIDALTQIVEPIKKELIESQRFYNLSKAILALKQNHDDLLQQIKVLPALTSRPTNEGQRQSFLKGNIILLKEQFSENLIKGNFSKYLELESEVRAYLYSHLIKMLGVNFPAAPVAMPHLTVDIFPELTQEKKEEYRTQFNTLYNSYINIKDIIKKLNLGGESVQQARTGKFLDLNALDNLTNKGQDSPVVGRGGPPPPPGRGGRGGPPPPPGQGGRGGPPPPPGQGGRGLPGRGAVAPATNPAEVRRIQGAQASLLRFVRTMLAWEGTIPATIINEDECSQNFKNYYGKLYNTVRDFYERVGRVYPHPDGYKEQFLDMAVEGFEKTVILYGKKSAVISIGTFKSYYRKLLSATIDTGNPGLPALDTAAGMNSFIAAFLAAKPDQAPKVK